MARGFTEAMGGTLRAEPTAGGGLTMVVTLPADPTAPTFTDMSTGAEAFTGIEPAR